MRCQQCGSGNVGVIGFEAAGRATYRYCRVCEHTWWETSGKQVATDEILQVASTIEPARRKSA